MMRLVDEHGLRETPREVLGEALPLFPVAVEELVLAEPDAHMQSVLRHRVSEIAADSQGTSGSCERRARKGEPSPGNS